MEQLAGQIQVATGPIEWIAFTVFSPQILAVITLLLSSTYLCDATRERPRRPRGRGANVIRSLSLLLLAIALLHYQTENVMAWRAMLRMTVGFVITIDLAYKIYDLKYMFDQAKKWTSEKIGSHT